MFLRYLEQYSLTYRMSEKSGTYIDFYLWFCFRRLLNSILRIAKPY